jgi:uncharacterized protein YjlB
MNQDNMSSLSDARFSAFVRPPEVLAQTLKDDGVYPNNDKLPLLAFQRALALSEGDPAAVFEALFRANQWVGSWRNGVYGFHHYHSTAHEVLGVYGGTARVQFGGEQGVVLSVSAGDVVVIPAGVAHKNLGASRDLRVVGAYPRGQRWDMCYGEAVERPQADQNIARVPVPDADPIYGTEGPLIEYWPKQDNPGCQARRAANCTSISPSF